MEPASTALHRSSATLICFWQVDKGSANGYSRCDNSEWHIYASLSSKRRQLHLNRYMRPTMAVEVFPSHVKGK